MQLQLRIKMNEKLFLRDPESSEIGRKIVSESIVMISQLGFEAFTFKKLAAAINTTEATIYRYFENKHRLLTYIVAWYWNWMEYLVTININNLQGPEKKLKKAIELLSGEITANYGNYGFNNSALYQVVVAESNKVYLTKDVNADNQNRLFKPYKDLCAQIAELISACNPKYKYPRSLASTLLEMAHLQYFFMNHLPSLTNFEKERGTPSLHTFLEHLVFSALKAK